MNFLNNSLTSTEATENIKVERSSAAQPINTIIKEAVALSPTGEARPSVILKTMLTRWLAINVCWLVGATVWTFFPFFQNQIGDQARTWIWNLSFIWFFTGLLWEGFWALADKDKYLNAKAQSVIALQAVVTKITKTFQQAKTTSSLEEETTSSEDVKQAFLFFAVRGFYLPLMIHFFLDHTSILQIPKNFIDFKLKVTNFAWLQDWIYFFDVLPFVAAYLINYGESRTRSVDGTLMGWFFCLACYPPFNGAWGEIFSYSHEEFAGIWGWASLVAIGIYAWSSVALGLKAGHLQYRGLCESGPYAFVRHPAYAFKNLAWLIGSVGWMIGQVKISASFQDAASVVLWNSIGSIFWFWIYHMRAVTEEKHLSKYPEYLAYCQKVKYRYIPYLV